MMVIFFFRIVAGAFYLYEMFVLVPRHAPLLSDMGIQGRVIPPLTLAFYALNIYWMYKIVKGALKAGPHLVEKERLVVAYVIHAGSMG